MPPFEAFLKLHGGEGFEEVMPFCPKHIGTLYVRRDRLLGGIAVENGYSAGFRMV